jgi:F420H(2)-dependent quinone reductase
METGLSGAAAVTVVRRGGGEQRIPVIPVEHGGGIYLVSTRGESDWVKNVRAHPSVTLTTRGGATAYRVVEVPVEQCEPLLAAYRATAGGAVTGYFRKLPDPADHPTFALTAV